MDQFLHLPSKTSQLNKNDKDKVKYAELKLCGFLAEHNLAFTNMDHFVDVIKDCVTDSNVCIFHTYFHCRLQINKLC